MSRLNPASLSVRFRDGTTAEGPLLPRRYTLTHSDSTGNLFLTIGRDYDRQQISGWYTRLMRDEVLAEWQRSPACPDGVAGGVSSPTGKEAVSGRSSSGQGDTGSELHVHCHVSGGAIFGAAEWRDAIFRRELRLVLEAFRFGDHKLYEVDPTLDRAPILVNFHSHDPRYNRVERWGVLADYRIGGQSAHG